MIIFLITAFLFLMSPLGHSKNDKELYSISSSEIEIPKSSVTINFVYCKKEDETEENFIYVYAGKTLIKVIFFDHNFSYLPDWISKKGFIKFKNTKNREVISVDIRKYQK